MNFLGKLGLKEIVLIFACLTIAALFVVFARNAYPVPGGDSSFFLVPAIQFANKGVLTSPLFPDEQALNLIDPSGLKKFLFYPPLFPLILSRGLSGASPIDIFITIAILNSLVIWLSAWIFYRAANREGELNWPRTFLLILGLLALASGLVGGSGRPEILASLWVALGLLVFFYIKKYDWLLYGILLGFMLATHLAGSIIALLILGVMLAVKFRPREFFLRIGSIILIGFLTLFSVISLGPFGIRETVKGTITNALMVSRGYASQFSDWFTLPNFLHYYFLSPATPFYGVVILLIFISGIFFYRKYRTQIVSPFIFAACVAGLVFMLGSIIYSVGHVFYLLIFAPVVFLGFLCYFSKSGTVPKMAVIVVFALVSSAFLRTIILYPYFLKEEPDFFQVREVFEKIVRERPNGDLKIGVTGSFWSISEDYDKIYLYNTWPEKPREDTAFIFFQQRYSGMLVPPEVPGCSLSENKFSPEAPRLFGIKLGNTTPGYNYAVYKCL